MRREILAVVLFIGTIFVGSFFIPALTGYNDSRLIVIFMAFIIACQPIRKSFIFLGLVFSLALELYWNLSFGSMILPFATTSFVFWVVGRSLNLKIDLRKDFSVLNFLGVILLNLVLVVGLTGFFGIFQRLFYGFNDGWSVELILGSDLVTIGELIIGSLVFWYSLRIEP